jgi:hypothetical protein
MQVDLASLCAEGCTRCGFWPGSVCALKVWMTAGVLRCLYVVLQNIVLECVMLSIIGRTEMKEGTRSLFTTFTKLTFVIVITCGYPTFEDSSSRRCCYLPWSEKFLSSAYLVSRSSSLDTSAISNPSSVLHQELHQRYYVLLLQPNCLLRLQGCSRRIRPLRCHSQIGNWRDRDCNRLDPSTRRAWKQQQVQH